MVMNWQQFLEEFAGTEGAATAIAMLGVFSVIAAIAGAIGLALYVIRAIGVYKMAKTADIANPWLAFIPVANVFPFGKLAEKVVKRDGTKSAKFGMILLVLKIVTILLSIAVILLLSVLCLRVIAAAVEAESAGTDFSVEILSGFIWLIPFSVVLSGLGIAQIILHYIVLYRIFVAFHYSNAAVYTALSVVGMFLFSDIVEPILLFVVRNNQPVFDYRDRLNFFTQNL